MENLKLSVPAMLTLATAMIAAPTDVPAQVYKGAHQDMTALRFEYPNKQQIVLTVTDDGDLTNTTAVLVEGAEPTKVATDLLYGMFVNSIDFDESGIREAVLRDKAQDLILSTEQIGYSFQLIAEIITVLVDPAIPSQTDENLFAKIQPVLKKFRQMMISEQQDHEPA